MGRRGTPTGIAGVLAVDKPAGMTSHDIVSAVRRVTGERRVGHAGTLDPAATGLLVVLIGPATRLAQYLTAAEKTYAAEIVFGTATATDDAHGELVGSASVPEALASWERAAATVAGLVGERMQVPPDFSAVKRGGVTAYVAARCGSPLELEPRRVRVSAAELISLQPGPPLTWRLSLTVSKGTYIRAIARDVGAAEGSAAHLGALRRTASGPLTLDAAHDLDTVLAATDGIERLFVDPVDALGLPVIEVGAREAMSVGAGSSLPGTAHAGRHIAVTDASRLLAVHEWDDSRSGYRPSVVVPGGVARCAP